MPDFICSFTSKSSTDLSERYSQHDMRPGGFGSRQVLLKFVPDLV